MSTRETELEDFKCRINLGDYAAGHGYAVDRRASSRNSIAMKHADGDKIILGMGHDQHWVYFSVGNPSDNGSIIDFVQQRRGMNLGQVRLELRPWLDHSGSSFVARSSVMGDSRTGTDAGESVPKPDPVVTDLKAVRIAYELAQPIEDAQGPFYLTTARSIPKALLDSERFTGRIRIDSRGNTLFPHWNAKKAICGYEIKNDGFTGFAPGGNKGLWCSAATGQDRRMVIAETAIDALSYAALFGYDDARFFSIAGQMNPHQPALLNQAMQKMPPGSKVILAVDHDSGGQAIAEYIEPIFEHVTGKLGRGDLQLVSHTPEIPEQDWNDVLRGDQPQPVVDPRPV